MAADRRREACQDHRAYERDRGATGIEAQCDADDRDPHDGRPAADPVDLVIRHKAELREERDGSEESRKHRAEHLFEEQRIGREGQRQCAEIQDPHEDCRIVDREHPAQ